MKMYSLGHRTSADDDGWETGLGWYHSPEEALADYNAHEAKVRGTGRLKFGDDALHLSDFNLWERTSGGHEPLGYPVYPI